MLCYNRNCMEQTTSTPTAEQMMADAKKQQVKSVLIGIVATVVVAGLGGLVLKFFGIDVFSYVSSYQIQQLIETAFGG